jgi:hypothetical protein
MIDSITIPRAEDYRLRAVAADLFDLQTYDRAKSGFFSLPNQLWSRSAGRAPRSEGWNSDLIDLSFSLACMQ